MNLTSKIFKRCKSRIVYVQSQLIFPNNYKAQTTMAFLKLNERFHQLFN